MSPYKYYALDARICVLEADKKKEKKKEQEKKRKKKCLDQNKDSSLLSRKHVKEYSYKKHCYIKECSDPDSFPKPDYTQCYRSDAEKNFTPAKKECYKRNYAPQKLGEDVFSWKYTDYRNLCSATKCLDEKPLKKMKVECHKKNTQTISYCGKWKNEFLIDHIFKAAEKNKCDFIEM